MALKWKGGGVIKGKALSGTVEGKKERPFRGKCRTGQMGQTGQGRRDRQTCTNGKQDKR